MYNAVMRSLQQLGLDVRAGFKPDVYTQLGIFSDNDMRLEPVIYSIKEVLDWPEWPPVMTNG